MRSIVAAREDKSVEFRTFCTKQTSIAMAAGLGLLSVYLAAAPVYSDWSMPVNLGSLVNSSAEDFAPHVSKNAPRRFGWRRPVGFEARRKR